MNSIISISNYLMKQKPMNYETLLSKIQNKYSKKYFELVSSDISTIAKKEKTLSFIINELQTQAVKPTEDYSLVDLAQKIYNDMDGYSILTKPLEDDNVEGINVNSWEDIRVKFIDGTSIKIDSFLNATQAKSIIQRLLQNSSVTMDDAVPVAEASMNSNIRITAVQTPIVDESIGVACYIRKLRHKTFTADEYTGGGFASEGILKLIQTAARRGVSILFVGKVNTGKTSTVKFVLDTLPDDMQIITIESGAREMNIVKKHKDGTIKNNVIHMLTRESEREEQNITQEKLVVKALRLNPDTLSVAEMRDIEAYAAQEASLSGHTVITTAHAGSVKQGHRRVAGLCRKKYSTDYHEAIINACEAFPLAVFIHMGEDNVRRIMNVSECYVDNDEKIHYNSLWEFEVIENKVIKGKSKVIGNFIQKNSPSEYLIEKMKHYGVTQAELSALMKDGV